MAVTFHNATVTAGPASVGTATILHTVSAADACLLVYTHANTAVSFSAIAANGLSLTRLGHISASSSRSEVWGLSAAPAATYSISANVVGAASLNFCLVVVSYIGQAQIGVNPFGTVVAGSAQGVANVAFSVSSTTTDLVSYGFGISANTTVAFNTGTSRGNTTHTTTGRLVVGDIAGAATISISATAAAAGTWSFLGVPIVASAVNVTTISFDNAAFTSTTGAKNSIGLLLTATANAVLLVWTNVAGGADTLSAVLVGGVPMTFLAGVDYRAAAARRVELWGMTAPPSGILTISAQIVGANTTDFGMGGVTYTGHRTTATPFGGTVTGSASLTAQAGLIVSSTLGNVVVVGWAGDLGSTLSPGPGTVARVNTGASWPQFLIADTAGFNNVTASVTSTAAVYFGIIGINLIQAGFRSGAAALTDVRDTLSATGYVLVNGRLSATGVTDKFSASGYVVVTGRLSATGAADRLSATGYVIVNGRLSATDAADIFSASGTVVATGNVTGRLSATEAADTFSASGYTIVSGRLSATDVTDKFSASGYTLVTARLSATDATDRFSASGYVIVTGRLSATDATDLFVAFSTVPAPTVVTTQDPGAGGGHKKQKEYFRPDDAFWEAREQYLLSLQPAIASEPEPAPTPISVFAKTETAPVDPSLLIAYRATRNKLVTSLPQASSMRQLKAQGQRLYEVNARIAEHKRLAAEQERLTVARLMSEARKLKRAQTIRRVKRRVILLAAARAAVALTYLIDKL